MRPRANALGWMDGEENDAASWTRNNEEHTKDDDMNPSLSTFKSILESGGWYMNNNPMIPSHQDFQTIPNHQQFNSNPSVPPENLLLQPIDSSSSCSPSQAFNVDPSNSQSFFPPTPLFPSLLNVVYNNPYENGFDFGSDTNLLSNHTSNSPLLMGFNGLSSQFEMGSTQLSSSSEILATSGGFVPIDFESSGDALFLNRSKVLRPLEISPPVGAQPTLFQKRAANKLQISGLRGTEVLAISDDGEFGKRKRDDEDEVEDSIDGLGLSYDSDENDKLDENGNNGGSNFECE
ncbi:basic helix-loop-helix (bHLH) DNA-binding superfamily protein [Actinidia rufa]|uniref:Basic helix-loop-helix (BHLH) DNA-binding superfamily protein n=1 Tax=Actinidia rufa TaxID=165716 RepID=A0A7J0E9P6_9ERIC|nr:basic helix-loop-helix (bHLH) DNA-binding superfamily protein [Actinidia rufa]